MKDDSKIVLHKGGGATIAGPDATEWYRASLLAASLDLYAKCGVIPTRGITGPRMLKMATRYSGKVYKRGEYTKAAADVRVWADTMKSALPIEDRREKPGGQ